MRYRQKRKLVNLTQLNEKSKQDQLRSEIETAQTKQINRYLTSVSWLIVGCCPLPLTINCSAVNCKEGYSVAARGQDLGEGLGIGYHIFPGTTCKVLRSRLGGTGADTSLTILMGEEILLPVSSDAQKGETVKKEHVWLGLVVMKPTGNKAADPIFNYVYYPVDMLSKNAAGVAVLNEEHVFMTRVGGAKSISHPLQKTGVAIELANSIYVQACILAVTASSKDTTATESPQTRLITRQQGKVQQGLIVPKRPDIDANHEEDDDVDSIQELMAMSATTLFAKNPARIECSTDKTTHMPSVLAERSCPPKKKVVLPTAIKPTNNGIEVYIPIGGIIYDTRKSNSEEPEPLLVLAIDGVCLQAKKWKVRCIGMHKVLTALLSKQESTLKEVCKKISCLDDLLTIPAGYCSHVTGEEQMMLVDKTRRNINFELGVVLVVAKLLVKDAPDNFPPKKKRAATASNLRSPPDKKPRHTSPPAFVLTPEQQEQEYAARVVEREKRSVVLEQQRVRSESMNIELHRQKLANSQTFSELQDLQKQQLFQGEHANQVRHQQKMYIRSHALIDGASLHMLSNVNQAATITTPLLPSTTFTIQTDNDLLAQGEEATSPREKMLLKDASTPQATMMAEQPKEDIKEEEEGLRMRECESCGHEAPQNAMAFCGVCGYRW